jgi:hypothetical protein
MRICETCGAPDQAALDFDLACKPTLCPPTADERPETHHDQCPRLIHEVRKLYRPATLEHTVAHPEGELSRKWRAEGWKLLKDGSDLFRWKLLCRVCIERVYEREENHKEYLQACKRARGETDQTYSELLTQQANA